MKRSACLLLCVLLFMSGCTVRTVEKPIQPPPAEKVTEAPAKPDTEPVTRPVTEAETVPETVPETEAPIHVVVGGGDVWTYPHYVETVPETEAPFFPPEAPETQYTPPQQTAPDGYSPVVFMYHLILEKPYSDLTGLFVRPSDFEAQLAALNAAGYKYLFADEFDVTSEKSVILTFDDGYADNYTEMFPLLKRYNAKATVFMITSAIDTPGFLSSAQIREMSASGLVSFGSHTVSHVGLNSLSEQTLRYELSQSRDTLSALTGKSVTAVCYPAGNVNSFVASVAAEYYSFGFTTRSSAYTYGCDPMLLPRVRVSRGMSSGGLLSQIP